MTRGYTSLKRLTQLRLLQSVIEFGDQIREFLPQPISLRRRAGLFIFRDEAARLIDVSILVLRIDRSEERPDRLPTTG